MKTILEDKRPIIGVYFMDSDGGHFEVGSFGCTKIEPYAEGGRNFQFPFLAIYYGESIKFRIPAIMVQISYGD